MAVNLFDNLHSHGSTHQWKVAHGEGRRRVRHDDDAERAESKSTARRVCSGRRSLGTVDDAGGQKRLIEGRGASERAIVDVRRVRSRPSHSCRFPHHDTAASPPSTASRHRCRELGASLAAVAAAHATQPSPIALLRLLVVVHLQSSFNRQFLFRRSRRCSKMFTSREMNTQNTCYKSDATKKQTIENYDHCVKYCSVGRAKVAGS